MKFVFQQSKISIYSLTDVINVCILSILKYVDRSRLKIMSIKQLKPIKKLILYTIFQPVSPHLPISVFTLSS